MKLLENFIHTHIKQLITETTMNDHILHLQHAVHKSAFKPAQAFSPLVQVALKIKESPAQKEILRIVQHEEQRLLRKKEIITKKENQNGFLAGFRLIPIYISLRANPNQPDKLLECLQQLKEILGAFPGLPVLAASIRSLKAAPSKP